MEEAVVWGCLYELPSCIPVLEVPEADVLVHGTADPLADVATQTRLAAEFASRAAYPGRRENVAPGRTSRNSFCGDGEGDPRCLLQAKGRRLSRSRKKHHIGPLKNSSNFSRPCRRPLARNRPRRPSTGSGRRHQAVCRDNCSALEFSHRASRSAVTISRNANWRAVPDNQEFPRLKNQ